MFTVLYIPLCLYFNEMKRVLKYPGSKLYIPLCLYFNPYSKFRMMIHLLLYIPLCLYFNLSLPVKQGKIINFTFHYVSILIIFCLR